MASLALYGDAYQQDQVAKYRNRQNNHWKIRLELADQLHAQHVAPRLKGRSPEQINVVDIGCSIGTFAIEYARKGYRAYGMDFDAAALKIAERLAAEEGVAPTFICGDVADWDPAAGDIDIAVCFDIYEHLFDDQLGALLSSIRRRMAPDGVMLFHTFPTEFDYIFFQSKRLWWPLAACGWMTNASFYRATRAYGSLLDAWHTLRRGRNYREMIEESPHCNPVTRRRLGQMLERAGFDILALDGKTLYEWSPKVQRRFSRFGLAQRNLYGAAVPRPR